MLNKNEIVAVVGVSHSSDKYGNKIFTDLLKQAYKVFGVNQKGGVVAGQQLYKNLAELPHVPDIVITVVSPAITVLIVEECVRLGVKKIWMQPGSESKLALNKAQNHKIEVVHNTCFMKRRGIW